MRARVIICSFRWALLCLALPAAVRAGAASEPPEKPHVRIEVIADRDAVGPGQRFEVALVQHIASGWHTYWTNPGDAGQATSLRWTLPPGYGAGEPHWPVPEVFRTGTDVSYGYENETVVLQQMHAPLALAPGLATLAVEVAWLACSDVCIPEHGHAELRLRSSAGAHTAVAPSRAGLFRAAHRRLPAVAPWPVTVVARATTLELKVRGFARDVRPGAAVHFVPLAWGQIDNAAEQQATWSRADLVLRMARGDLRTEPLSALDGVLVVGTGAGPPRRGFVVHAAVAAADREVGDIHLKEDQP